MTLTIIDHPKNLARPIEASYLTAGGQTFRGQVIRLNPKSLVFATDGKARGWKTGKPTADYGYTEYVLREPQLFRLAFDTDSLVAALTAADTMAGLLGPRGCGYQPTISLSQSLLHPVLADRIDEALQHRDEYRRAYRTR